MIEKLPLTILLLCLTTVSAADDLPVELRAGAAAVNIDPPRLPVLKNGGFLQASADKITSSLYARSLVLESGGERLAICVVDSCMVPRELCDRAKELAADAAGLAADHILISATHTHSAPSAMRALGCAADPEYPDYLVGKMAESLEQAARALRPAQAGWNVVDAGHYTNTRRWIFLPHKMRTDPFGQVTVRAMMHPGHANPDTAGPSGPIDPDLTVLSIQDAQGRPLAVLGNFSMHYYGAEGLSSDYTGRVCQLLEEALGTDDRPADASPFVALMSQGTSGDLHFMDYSRPLAEQPYQGKPDGFERYCRGLSDLVQQAAKNATYRADLTLNMAEARLPLQRRLPDAERLAWAERTLAGSNEVPRNQAEVYAREALWIRDNPTAELKLQAIRIGELGITAIPDEVFGLTGLKLKLQSPLRPTMNIALANGSEGYIPPPEQHDLGGYTTWPARTAGLEVQAEPKITDTVLALLERVSGSSRRSVTEEIGAHGRELLAQRPLAWWRMSAHSGHGIPDATGGRHMARLEPGYALFLPGPAGAAFTSTERGNRAVHLAGGRMVAENVKLAGDYTVSFWFWNALPVDARETTGCLVSIGTEGSSAGDQLCISGTAQSPPGRLLVSRGNGKDDLVLGPTPLALHRWHHVVFVRGGDVIRVHLDGRLELKTALPAAPPAAGPLILGCSSDGTFSFEGKLDEVAVYNRDLTLRDCQRLFPGEGTE